MYIQTNPTFAFGPQNMGQQYDPRLRLPPGPRSQSKPVKVTIPYSVKPKDRTAGTSSPSAFQCCPCLKSRYRAKQLSFSLSVTCVPGSALGSIAARHAYWSGNQVPEATFITFHSHLTIHLQLMILDLQLH